MQQKKWQIFKIVVITQLIITGFFIAILCIASVQNYREERSTDMYFFGVGIAIFFTLLLFYILCTQFVFKYYPNQKISIAKNIAFNTLYWLSFIIEFLIAFIVGSAIIDHQNMGSVNVNWGYVVMIFSFVLYFILLLYTLIHAYKLRKIINKNASILEQQLIETLGQHENF